jgi:trigger factor
VKVTTEKLPRSIMALDIELTREQVEKGLDRAARRLSQKYTIPGFRKGKAPRFIIENYFGRAALIEEATEDLLQKAYREALEQEKIEPAGQGNLVDINLEQEPYTIRVQVPVAPTITIPAEYRDIRRELKVSEITEEDVDRAMARRRDKHAVLKDLEEPRSVQDGDQLTVLMDAYLDGELLDDREPGTPPEPSTIVVDKDRLVPGLYDGLLGLMADQSADIVAHVPGDHPNEKVRDQDVSFSVTIQRIQERLLPDWEELPTLEEFEGTLEELREKTRMELVETARTNAETEVVDGYINDLVAQTEFDIPDVMIQREADRMLQQQEASYTRYGVKPDQIYEARGETRDEALEKLLPQAEERLKVSLALQQVMTAEQLSLDPSELIQEVEDLVNSYEEAQRDKIRSLLREDLLSSIASSMMDRKLRARVLAIATGAAPAIGEEAAPEDAVDSEADSGEESADAAEPSAEEPPAVSAETTEATSEITDEKPEQSKE